MWTIPNAWLAASLSIALPAKLNSMDAYTSEAASFDWPTK